MKITKILSIVLIIALTLAATVVHADVTRVHKDTAVTVMAEKQPFFTPANGGISVVVNNNQTQNNTPAVVSYAKMYHTKKNDAVGITGKDTIPKPNVDPTFGKKESFLSADDMTKWIWGLSVFAGMVLVCLLFLIFGRRCNNCYQCNCGTCCNHYNNTVAHNGFVKHDHSGKVLHTGEVTHNHVQVAPVIEEKKPDAAPAAAAPADSSVGSQQQQQ